MQITISDGKLRALLWTKSVTFRERHLKEAI